MENITIVIEASGDGNVNTKCKGHFTNDCVSDRELDFLMALKSALGGDR